MRFAIAVLLFLPGACCAGDSVEYRVGTLRKECNELREWDYWQRFSDSLLIQTQRFDDEDTVELRSDTYQNLHLALIRWKVEQKKTPYEKQREAVAAMAQSFWFWHGDKFHTAINALRPRWTKDLP